MKYDVDTSLEKIFKRSDEIRREAKNRVTALLSVAALVLAAGEGFLWSLFVNSGDAQLDSTAYGAVLLMGESGAYVLIGVLAFVLGVVITLICIRTHHKSEKKNGEEQS